MPFPTNYTFRFEALNASSSSSNTQMAVAVPFRSILVDAFYCVNPLSAGGGQTTTGGVVDITVNGTTAGIGGGVAGWGQLGITTSTGGSTSTQLSLKVGQASVVTLNAGDILGTSLSSCCGGNTTYVVRAF